MTNYAHNGAGTGHRAPRAFRAPRVSPSVFVALSAVGAVIAAVVGAA